ncbi:peptide chain release factor N(5)-glutamine methyltransferase [Prevotella sp. 885]|uniref:peptide chain release factor N(5)-glutamine methyltransferase n=1 Tax=Prevotella sp. 885 TaxID=2022527 RepID=UPI000BA080F2|nr:peptide chain release factor N(5)-glutamine methyltransferase [Prevotella sp. 885]OZT04917.1 protein-(glutamine-N5) methyltransferase, release factor-specific [Prevotella sp. 885]
MTYHDICQRLTPMYGPQEAKAMTRMLLEDLFSLSFADILCGATEHLSDADTLRLQQSVARLLDAEPLQYVTGTAFFCGHPFHVAPGVLIPRPETEWIVDTAVNLVTSSAPRILDIGTGSGCIATSISLALADRHCHTEAWDISEDALRIAADNAERLGADVKFRRRDALRLEEDFPAEENQSGAEVLIADNASSASWDIIVSNPPYICNREAADMHANVLRHEPHLALFVPDTDPLLFYRAIARYAMRSLRKGGWLLFECNTLYAHDTAQMASDMGFATSVVEDDCFGKPRFVKAQK